MRTVAAGGLAVTAAGCLGEDRFWDDPPPFDADGLESVTDAALPDRPDPIPVALSADRLAAFATRVEALLEPIPEPLTEKTVPNGKIRAAIDSDRSDARTALDRLSDRADTISKAEAAADACGHAAGAAGVWAAITSERSFEDVTISRAELSTDRAAFTDSLPAAAAGPAAGAAVYGPLDAWFYLVEDPPDPVDPIRAGRWTRFLERRWRRIRAGDAIRTRYVDSLAEPRSIAADLERAVDALGPHVRDRIADYTREGERLAPVDPVTLLDRDANPDEPGVRLLSRKLGETFDRVWTGPLPSREGDVSSTPQAICLTERTLAAVGAVAPIVDRLDGGDELFPDGADAVREARGAAIDAVASLGDDSPLETWLARSLVIALADVDETLARATVSDLEAIAGAYGEYVWLESVARSAPDATATVAAALEG
ncbi:hypothetical protein DVR14_14495 [Natrinema thermotolerans]|nr:hypothetical protein DVR14_14495 [Natrinema thermotolerans]